MKYIKILLLGVMVVVLSGCGLFGSTSNETSGQKTVAEVYQDEYDYYVEYVYLYVERINSEATKDDMDTETLEQYKAEINTLFENVEGINTYNSERLVKLKEHLTVIYESQLNWIDLLLSYQNSAIDKEQFEAEYDETLQDMIYHDEELIIIQKAIGVYNSGENETTEDTLE